jgi:Family of unknown function (DUF6011)
MTTNTMPQVPIQIARDTVLGATDKQIAFIKKLIVQVHEKIGTNDTGLSKNALDFIDKVLVRLDRGDLNKRDASKIIETLIAQSTRSYEAPVIREKAPIGVYKRGEDIYRVIKGRQSSNTYAQKLATDPSGQPVWDYAGGMIFELKVQELISPEVAAQMGRSVGYCVICGRFLTDAESVAKGIGPVCEKNTSITYAQHRN